MARALDALVACACRLAEGHDEARDDLRRFATFFEQFGDLTHYAKVEDVLLPYLVRAGFAYDSGPLGALCSDHHQEGYLVEVVHHAAEQLGTWTGEDRRHALAAIFGFVDFVRERIRLEEGQLYPEVLGKLSDAQLIELERLFHEYDEHSYSHTTADRLSALAEDLIGRYQVPRGSPPLGSGA